MNLKNQVSSSERLRSWDDNQRIAQVRNIFAAITPSYDKLNHILSAGQDILWRRKTAARMDKDSRRVLDIAIGTSDLAIEFARKHPSAVITGVDFSKEMMEFGRVKSDGAGFRERIFYALGDGTELPVKEGVFDAVSIAFGIRNIPNKGKLLKEMLRVLKPGGQILILEMTFPKNLQLRRFFLWYFRRVIPVIGGIISGNFKAYNYLPDSIKDFLRPEELTAIMRGAGIERIEEIRMTMGITYLHLGRKSI